MRLLRLLLLCLIQLACLAAASRSRSNRRNGEHHEYSIRIIMDGGQGSNTRIVLTCLRDNAQVSNAAWTKDGKIFDEATAPERRVSINATGITINSIRPQDEGEYRCNESEPFELTSTCTPASLFVIIIVQIIDDLQI